MPAGIEGLRELLGGPEHVPLADAPFAELGAFVLRQEALDRISRALCAEGCRALLVKGSALALTAYSRPWARTMDDLDLLVLRADLDRAAGALVSGGFVRLDAPGRALSRGSFGETHFSVRHGSVSILVELHVGLDKIVSRPVDYAGIFARATPAKGLPSLFVPAVEDHVLLVALHAAGHEFRHDKAWGDLERLLGCGVDAEALARRAREWKLETVLFVALATLRAAGGARAHGELASRLEPGRLRKAAIATCYDVGSFPLARGPYRPGLAWLLRQCPLRDDLLRWARGIARYAALRAADRAIAVGARLSPYRSRPSRA